ncbi:MAG TPA: hypothetical protein VE397_15720 [Stellaceae bacterium]|nr:hypothetical protein [Stellaceae bacterium]
MQPRRWPSRRAALALALLPLAACGFQPLYSEQADERESPELAAIIVSPIADRYGQELELALREALNPGALAVKPLYRLDVTVNVQRIDLGIQRDASSTRGRIDSNASLTLIDIASGHVIYRASTQSSSNFNIVQDAYAAQVAEDDSRVRTVRELTDEIRTRLTLFLRDHMTASRAAS